MNIKEYLNSDRHDSTYHLFKATSPSGEERLLCVNSFVFQMERKELLSNNPDIMEWEVTQERIPSTVVNQ